MSDETYEFASPEWLEAVRRISDEMGQEALAAGELTDDVDFSMCEVYTDVPGHINPSSRVAWCTRVKGSTFSFAAEEADDVDVKIVSDWETVAPLGRMEYDILAPPPDVTAKTAAAHGSGKMKMIMNRAPKAPPSFAGAHNRIARITR